MLPTFIEWTSCEATALRVKKGHSGQIHKNAQQEKRGEDESRITNCALTMVSQMKFPKVSLKEAMIVLARGAAEPWLRVHGKMRRPEMSKKDAMELRECFDLIDSEGSGAIAADEVPLVFTVLGMDLKKQEIDAAVEEFNGERPIVLPLSLEVVAGGRVGVALL